MCWRGVCIGSLNEWGVGNMNSAMVGCASCVSIPCFLRINSTLCSFSVHVHVCVWRCIRLHTPAESREASGVLLNHFTFDSLETVSLLTLELGSRPSQPIDRPLCPLPCKSSPCFSRGHWESEVMSSGLCGRCS